MTSATRALPFEGLHVLDLSWVVAGPSVGRVLADYGATVVRVETSRRVETARVVGPFHGGTVSPEHSALYGNVNAGKLGLALDLSREEARAVVRDLVRWADVVTESYAPGVMQRWGLGYDAMRAIRPDIIMLSTSLMGQDGPHAVYAGYGNAGAAVSGFQNMVGWPGQAPIGPFGPYTDYIAPRFSLLAVLAALDQRRRTGEGCYIDHSQAESGLNFLGAEFATWYGTGMVTTPRGNQDLALAPHGVYPCLPDAAGRERWVAIAVRDDAEWHQLCALLDRPDLAADERYGGAADRRAHASALDDAIAAWTAAQTTEAVEERCIEAGIPAHVVSDSTDLAADPQLVHRGHFIALDHPLHGSTVVEGSRMRLSRTPASVTRAAPTYGQDNDDVLRGILGYDDGRIEELAALGVLE